VATLDTSYVKRELQSIIASSKAVAKLVHGALSRLEKNPGQFPLLDHVPRKTKKLFPHAIFRKVVIEHERHSFRLVVIHWRRPNAKDHVDVIYAFPRKKGYPIDWDEVDSFAEDC
jgi:hypothetical protein